MLNLWSFKNRLKLLNFFLLNVGTNVDNMKTLEVIININFILLLPFGICLSYMLLPVYSFADSNPNRIGKLLH